MSGQKEDPLAIYQIVMAKIEKVLETLEGGSTDSEIIEYQNEAKNKLHSLYRTLGDTLQSLEKNSEWDVFTIAFYGETNAGKSTLIEILRILLKEKSKLRERETYAMALNDYKQLEFKINDLERTINSIDNYNANQMREHKGILENFISRKNDLENSFEEMESRVYELNYEILHKVVFRLGDFIKSIFKKLYEQNELDNVIVEMTDLEVQIDNLEKDILKKREEIDEINLIYQSDKKIRTDKVKRLNQTLAEVERILITNSDADIVGDGRSDYTQKVNDYRFEIGSQKFSILDLPGIEGNEKSVQNEIDSAVQKAHVVFYISSNSNPPQKGDDESAGTIAKIRDHLKKQSEVYFVYNKRVKNPRQLSKTLISEGESESLNVVDHVMQDILDEQYIQHLSLSGYPALVSIGNYWGTGFEKSQKKFIEKFISLEAILNYSKVDSFANWMTKHLVDNIRYKIEKSNLRKVVVSLNETSSNLNEISESFTLLEQKLKSTLNDASKKLEKLEEEFYRDLLKSMDGAINTFKNSLRKKVYSDIDQVINNDQFSKILKDRTEEEVKLLIEEYEKRVQNNAEDFETDVSDVVEKYMRYVDELLVSYSDSVNFNFEFNPKINIKKNIKIAEVTSTLIGQIVGIVITFMYVTNPIGWVILALSVIGFIFSTSKTVFEFINSDYRKSQQKKSTNENIEAVANKLRESLEEEVNKTVIPVNNTVKKIKKEIKKSVNQVEVMAQVFEEVGDELKIIAANIEHGREHIYGDN